MKDVHVPTKIRCELYFFLQHRICSCLKPHVKVLSAYSEHVEGNLPSSERGRTVLKHQKFNPAALNKRWWLENVNIKFSCWQTLYQQNQWLFLKSGWCWQNSDWKRKCCYFLNRGVFFDCLIICLVFFVKQYFIIAQKFNLEFMKIEHLSCPRWGFSFHMMF